MKMKSFDVAIILYLTGIFYTIQCHPYGASNVPQGHSYDSKVSPANVAAYSAASYNSLGIQPSSVSLGAGNSNKYWWQGPNSPFSPGAAQGQGITAGVKTSPSGSYASSGSSNLQATYSNTQVQQSVPSRPVAVVGCSGDGCSSLPPETPSASYGGSSSNAAAATWWQQPGNPCATHEGPGCPSGYACVNYQSCVNGVISSTSSYSSRSSYVPSLRELQQYGRPCGSSGTEVCCQQPAIQPSVQPVVQATLPPPTPAPLPPPYQPVTPTQPQYQQPINLVPQYQQPINPVPQYQQPSNPIPQYQQPSNPVPEYRPPTNPPPVRPPPPPQTQPSIVAPAPQQPVPEAPATPYPGCAAALKCVKEEFCNVEGVMVNTPVFLTPLQKEYRVPLMACLDVATNQVGYCCRDPNYEDPWPQDMPMPNMPKPAPVTQPVVVQTPTVQIVSCAPQEECVPEGVCLSRSSTIRQGFTKRVCQSIIDGRNGICCNRAPVPQQPIPQPSVPVPPQPLPPPAPVAPLPPPPAPLPPPPAPVAPLPPPPAPVAPLPPPPAPVAPLPPPQPSYIPPPQQAVVSASLVSNECGIGRTVSQAIGEASAGDFPWHAVIILQDGTRTCSGALIGSKYVVTAAHCVKGQNPTGLRVRLGQTSIPENSQITEIPAIAVITHPEFQDGSLFNDIALIVLNQAVANSANIRSVCLPTAGVPSASQCIATGFGKDTLLGRNNGGLTYVQMNLIRHADCQSTLQQTHLGKYFQLHKNFVCAASQPGNNACKVDEGSPIVCQPSPGRYVLAGLSSWSAGCTNQQIPSVFTDVSSTSSWLNSQMSLSENQLVSNSNTAFQNQQQFQSQFGQAAGYGR